MSLEEVSEPKSIIRPKSWFWTLVFGSGVSLSLNSIKRLANSDHLARANFPYILSYEMYNLESIQWLLIWIHCFQLKSCLLQVELSVISFATKHIQMNGKALDDDRRRGAAEHTLNLSIFICAFESLKRKTFIATWWFNCIYNCIVCNVLH